ncbi:MAG: hypothetical protein R3F62_12745 [Planctomycetota bacterium]
MIRPSALALLAAPLALGLGGCSSAPDLTQRPGDGIGAREGAPVALSLAPTVDLRPEAERDGLSPDSATREAYYVYNESLQVGSHVTGDQDFAGSAPAAVDATLRAYLDSSGALEVSDGAGAYRLHVELLHLFAARHEELSERTVYPVVPVPLTTFELEDRFVPHATAVLRLRLLGPEGEPLATRVINQGVVGRAEVPDALGELAGAALRGAAHQARTLVTSWVHRAERRAGRGAPPPPAGSFLVHSPSPAYLHGTRVARIDRATGAVLMNELREGLPRVGRPGEWYLSPFDEDGVALAGADYARLAAELDAAGFTLRRGDQLVAYHYFAP